MGATKTALSVTGAVAVLRLEDGSDRYLYKGAHIDRALYSEDWSSKQLDAFAEKNGIDLGKAKTKPEKVAAIVAATSV